MPKCIQNQINVKIVQFSQASKLVYYGILWLLPMWKWHGQGIFFKSFFLSNTPPIISDYARRITKKIKIKKVSRRHCSGCRAETASLRCGASSRRRRCAPNWGASPNAPSKHVYLLIATYRNTLMSPPPTGEGYTYGCLWPPIGPKSGVILGAWPRGARPEEEAARWQYQRCWSCPERSCEKCRRGGRIFYFILFCVFDVKLYFGVFDVNVKDTIFFHWHNLIPLVHRPSFSTEHPPGLVFRPPGQ